MIRTFAMLAHVYEDQPINGWFASEKLDGCKALWLPNLPSEYSNDPDIEPTGLWTRDGKVIHAPKWWLSHLPKVPLDGELWLDREEFQQTMSIVRRKEPDVKNWQHIKFMAIDMPVKFEAGILRYRKREVAVEEIYFHDTIKNMVGFKFVQQYLKKNTKENNIYRIVEQTVIRNVNQLNTMLEDVLSRKGEGLMLRDPFSTWEQCRSHKLLKMKPFHMMEVEVLGYFYGDGKHYGRLGALEVKDKSGRIFKVGTGFTDAERRISSIGLPFTRSRCDDSQFPIGSTIAIRYRELTKGGIPKEGRYDRPE